MKEKSSQKTNKKKKTKHNNLNNTTTCYTLYNQCHGKWLTATTTKLAVQKLTNKQKVRNSYSYALCATLNHHAACHINWYPSLFVLQPKTNTPVYSTKTLTNSTTTTTTRTTRQCSVKNGGIKI